MRRSVTSHPTRRALGATLGLAWRASPAELLLQALVTTLTGMAPVAAAWLLRSILDDLIAHDDRRHVLLLVVLLGIAGGAGVLLPNFGQYLSAQFGRAVQTHAIAELFTAVARLAGLRKLEDPAFQDRLRVAEQAGSSGPSQIMTSGTTLVQSAVTISGFLITVAVLSPVMAAVLLAAAIPAIYLERGVAKRQFALITEISHGQRRQFFYANLLVSLPAAKEIRLFRLGAFFRRRMLEELRGIQRARQQVDRRALAANTALAVISAVVAGGGLLWAVLAATDGRLSVGDVSVFVAALGTASTTLATVITSAVVAHQGLLQFGSYQEVLAEEADLPVRTDPVPATALRHSIEVDDVWFRYGPDEPWILKGVSCVIPHGQAVALVGSNGAGKSTLVKLLCRFYDPNRGRILWDGVDLRDLDLAELRDRISAVFQDYMAYELTARENIAAGDLSLGDQMVSLTSAARQAGIDDALAALPRGYDTMLTRSFFDLADKDDPQTGVLLSGGQWQRMALARAFLRGGRDLMILDEPSSGLDPEAEHEIHVSLAEQRRGRATVLISHRLNTVRDAENIIVLADGVITEQGSHESLMAQSGTYARLFSLQAKGYETELSATGS